MRFSHLKTAMISSLLIFIAAPASFADHSWAGYHWARQDNPFTLPIIDSVTANWFVEMDESLTRWSQATSLEVVVVESQTDSTTRLNCPMAQGKVRICNANYGSTGWLGLASIGINATGHLDKGVTRINDYYSSSWNSQSMKNHVMCHEIGHQFGLDHTSEDGSSQGSCMDYSQSISSQWPNAHDYEMIDDVIYAHLDNHDSFAGGSSGSSDGGSTGGSDGGSTGGSEGGSDGGSGSDSGCSGKGADKDCNGVPDHKEGGGSTTDGSSGSGSGCSGKGNDKNCNGIPDNKESGNFNNNSWTSNIPPLGVRISSTKHGETWVSARGDGGLWVHHIYKAEDYATPGNSDHDHGGHDH